ncbi:MAG: hypothetical protein JWP69_1122 [Flaviaesturariibacter sp.]|nr:hypothetical protein [Flaviaesturariibacter sp.]
MISKLNRHLKERGVAGTARQFKKCLNENGLEYTIKQIFKPLQPDLQENVHIPATIPSQAEDAKNIQAIDITDNRPKRIVPRPCGIRKYPENALETILELRLPQCKGIFVQAPVIDWEVPLFQRPQHMAIAMAKAGYLVFYMTLNWIDEVEGFVEVYPNLFIASRLDLPFTLKNAYVSIYSTSPFYVPEQLAEIRKNNKIIYEYIDDIDPKISGEYTPKLIRQFDYISDDTVDLVAVSGRVLIEDIRKKVSSEKIVYVPNGVEFEHYQSALAFDSAVPENLKSIIAKEKPIVGYFGALAPWLWYELIEEVTLNMPDFEFIFIGPDYYGGVARLPQRENVHYLGVVDYKTLPSVAKHFDVAIIPFAPGQIAKTTSPLKLFEYFALQIPVVVTSEMQECIAFPEVLSGHAATNFIKQLRKAYSQSDSDELKKKLLSRALENSWEMRALTLKEKIEDLNNCR